MKCIVIQTSPERINAEPVTNEDSTPYVYATMAEARAELKANGYIYNRANQRYYINGTEYRAYILRADSEEYAEIMEQAEQQAAPEYIEPEHIQTVNGNKIYRSIDPVTGWNVFTVAGRDFWELAEARYFAQCNPAGDTQTAAAAAAAKAEQAADAAEQAARKAIEAHAKGDKDAAAEAAHEAAIFADKAAAASLEAYHISGNTCDTPEYKAAGDAAERASIASSKAIKAFYDIEERAELAAVEAAAPEALASEDNPEDAVNLIAYTAFADINDGATPDTYDNNDMEQLDRLMGYAAEIVRRDGSANGIQWAPYQRAELEAFLGDYVSAYDVDDIEAEATTYDPKTGRAVWTLEAVRDLAAIAERHELKA